MKKIYLYAAALAMAMTACSQDESINVNEAQLYTLDAEIAQESDVNSRVNIGVRDTLLDKDGNKKPYSRVNWEAGDTFLAYKAGAKFDTDTIQFTCVEADKFYSAFATTHEFTEADITYAAYPKKRIKGLRKGTSGFVGSRIMLGLTKDQNMSESQDAIMIGKYDTGANRMKFVQTMTMLEIVLPEGTLKDNVCIQVEADKPIVANNSEAKIEIVDNEKGFSGAVEILPNKGTNIINLVRNGNYAGTKVYCAIPAGEYKSIKVSKGEYTGSIEEKNLEVSTITLLKTVKPTEEKFTTKKRLYVIDCTK